MNYLAHLALSNRQMPLMLGNFVADDMPRKEEHLVPKEIWEGVLLHRHIDQYTDEHASFKAAVDRLRPLHRKYAPVVIDILNDHLLSLNWRHYFSEDESDFHDFVYNGFSNTVHKLPPLTSLHVQSLLQYKYLKAYGEIKGMRNVLARMDRRTNFPSDFKAAIDHLYVDFEFYEDRFNELFSELMNYVDGLGFSM